MKRDHWPFLSFLSQFLIMSHILDTFSTRWDCNALAMERLWLFVFIFLVEMFIIVDMLSFTQVFFSLCIYFQLLLLILLLFFLLLLYVRRSPELPPPKVARSPAAVSRELSNHSHVYLAVSQRTRNRPRNSHIKSSSWTRNERAREKEERIIEIYLPPQKEERRKKLMREHLHGSIKSVFSRAFC